MSDSVWDSTYAIATTLTNDRRSAARVGNLAIAASLADGRWRGRSCGAGLRERIHALALGGIDLPEGLAFEWQRLSDAASASAIRARASEGLDEWVGAFQQADPARKTRGAYATPSLLAEAMARRLVETIHRTDKARIRVVDPSAGAGALLIAVFKELKKHTSDVRELRQAALGLHGVELDPVARELCCLLLWIAAGSSVPLDKIADNIVVDNAITRDWFRDELFDGLIMNPPWESLRHEVATNDSNATERALTLVRLAEAEEGALGLPPLYSGQGRGDRNLYKAFIELAPHLLRDQGGALAALLPAAFGSDLGTSELRRRYMKQLAIVQWTSFENLKRLFPIDARYKFGIVIGQRSDSSTASLHVRAFATDVREIEAAHVRIEPEELAVIGGESRMFPEVVSRAEVVTMKRYLGAGDPFFGRTSVGRVSYRREVDLTEGRKSGRFIRTESAEVIERCPNGEFLAADGSILVPLMEGRMVGQYDFFQKSWVDGGGRTAMWRYNNGSPLMSCTPQFLAMPCLPRPHRLAICDVTASTNTRTVHACWVPPRWTCGNTAPVLEFESLRFALAGLGVLNSMVFDWLVRRMVAGLHLNKFYLAALTWPRLSEHAVSSVASASATLLMRFNVRARDLSDDVYEIEEMVCDASYVEALAAIEIEVARGFGLSASMLKRIFDPGVTDRRGFWRHFATDPHASDAARLALDGYARRTIATRG